MKGRDLMRKRGPGERKERITVVSTAKTTTNEKPLSLRLLAREKAELQIWIRELEELAGKKMTPAKVLRGLIHMRKSINTQRLIRAINEAT